MSLVVNRRDVAFLLYEVFDLPELLAHARYAAYDRSAIEAILDAAQVIAEEEFLPFAGTLDADEPVIEHGKVRLPSQVGRALGAYAAAGLFSTTFEESAGGLQMPWILSLLLQGMFHCANVAVANYAMLTAAAANLLAKCGSDQLKRQYLQPMLAGRWFGTMCLSEPQAGSSLADITTRAEIDTDGHYCIFGHKMWISGGEHDISENIIHLVLAKTLGAPPGTKGISLFVVPKFRLNPDGTLGKSNNIALAGLNHKMGQRAITNCLLNFGETGPCYGQLVGEIGSGLAYMFEMMNEARLAVGLSATMLGLAGYLHSLDYAKTRVQGRSPRNKDPGSPQIPIIRHADIKRMLLGQKAAVEGALSLICFCATLIDRKCVSVSPAEQAELQTLLELLTPIAKSWPSEHCLEANKLAIQILGGCGYTRDFPVERIYRDNRLNHIHEGSYGIQAIDLVGRKLRLNNRAALAQLFDQFKGTVGKARQLGFSREADALDAAAESLRITTDLILACPDVERALANATLYLDAMGHIVIGWMWLKQALSAQLCLSDETSESDRYFYEGKISALKYFFRYELPKVHTQLALLSVLDETCLSMRDEEFLGS